MSSGRDASPPQRVSPPARVVRVWRDLPRERRLAALACAGLFLSLFLPWYQETVFANGVSTLRSVSTSLTGWGAFSFVEAAVLLVAVGVLVLLFVRAEGRAFHVPGGDGGVITAAGFWTGVLIVWRIFDKQGTSRHGQIAYTSGIEWGIFVALGVAALLTYAGSLIRLAHEPEPPLPGEEPPSSTPARGFGVRLPRKRREEPRRPPAPRAYPGPDMGADDEWTQELRARREPPSPGPGPPRSAEPPTRREPPSPPSQQPHSGEAPTGRVRPRSVAAPAPGSTPAPETGHSGRPLDRRDIRELALDEPPTARLGRSAPARPPDPPDAEPPTERQGSWRPGPEEDSSDQLTVRLDRPD